MICQYHGVFEGVWILGSTPFPVYVLWIIVFIDIRYPPATILNTANLLTAEKSRGFEKYDFFFLDILWYR